MTITTLTIRQFLKSRSLVVIAIICLIPVAVAVIPHLLGEMPSIRTLRSTMARGIYLDLYSALLLPISVLVLASAAFGDEIDDKTLHTLVLKPISRSRIVLEKFLAVIIVAIPVLWISLLIVWAVISWGNLDAMKDMVLPIFASSLLGILGFGSIFLMVSLFMRRTLLLGMFYVTIWEGAITSFLPGIRSFSVSHYSRSMFVDLLGDERITISSPTSATQSVITVLAITAVSLAIAIWKLRRMAID